MSLIIVKQPNDGLAIFSETYCDFLYTNLDLGMFLKIQKNDKLCFKNTLNSAMIDVCYELCELCLAEIIKCKGEKRHLEIIKEFESFTAYTLEDLRKAMGIA